MRDDLKPKTETNRGRSNDFILASEHPARSKFLNIAIPDNQQVHPAKSRRDIEPQEPERWDGMS